MNKITPFLWYTKDAAAAAALYTSLFGGRIVSTTSMGSESPSGPPGSIEIVEFELFGQTFTAMGAAGSKDGFNDATSFVVRCDDQAEVDKYWAALTADGGEPRNCGWLRDRFGVAWQIVPTRFFELMKSSDRAASKRVTDAMMKMHKFDIAALEAAANRT